jgi:predicted ATPase
LGGKATMPALGREALRLAELRLTAVEKRVDADLALGLASDVIGELRSLASENPFRERVQAGLMRALDLDGRQTEALAVYSEFRARCVEETGLEPGPELRDLQRAIVSGRGPSTDARAREPALPVTRPPVPMSELIGRETETRALVQEILTGKSRLVTVLGPGGVGKTRLALEAVEQSRRDFLDGACWVELADLTDADQVAGALARALGVRESTGEAVAASVRTLLADREILVALDNAEHLMPGVVELLADLIRSTRSAMFLVTSRVAFRIPAEQRHVLEPLDATAEPGDGTLSVAGQLMIARARAVRPSWELTQETIALVNEMASKLEGLPLALELAAARTNVLSFRSVNDRLDRRFSLLTASGGAGTDHHSSLLATVAWSVGLLSADEKETLLRLSVFRGGFTLAAAEAVCQDARQDGTVLDLLAALVDASLVVADFGVDRRASRGEVRYRMLETIREFAYEALAVDATAAMEAHDRHARYWAGQLSGLATRVLPVPATPVEAEQLEIEEANIRLAVEHAQAISDQELFSTLVLATSGWQASAGAVARHRDWLEALVANSSDPMSSVAAQTMIVYLSCWEGRFPWARERLDGLLARPEMQRLPAWKAAAESMLAFCVFVTEDETSRGEALAEQCLKASRSLADPHVLSFVLCTLGGSVPDPDLSRALLDEARVVAGGVNDTWASVAASNLVDTELGAGRVERSEMLAEEALDLAEGLRSLFQLNIAKSQRGAALLAVGDTRQALAPLVDALVFAEWSGVDRLFFDVIKNLAVIASMTGETEHASIFYAAYHNFCDVTGENPSPAIEAFVERHVPPELRRKWVADGPASHECKRELRDLVLGRATKIGRDVLAQSAAAG